MFVGVAAVVAGVLLVLYARHEHRVFRTVVPKRSNYVVKGGKQS